MTTSPSRSTHHALALCLAAAAMLGACASDDDSPPAAPAADAPALDAAPRGALQQGADAFREAFLADRYEDLPAALDLLARAYEQSPDDPAATRQLYFAWFWRVGEMSRAAPAPSPGEAAGWFENFGRLNAEARALHPDDDRMDGWLGATLVIGARAQGDAGLDRQGRALLASGRQKYPVFGHFMTVISFDEQPPGSPDWDEAMASLWASVDLCAGAPVDRANPDIGPYLARRDAPDAVDACWAMPTAPHAQEGMYLYYGDLLVKQGEVGAARAMYRNAQLARGYGAWRDRPLLEERLASDLAARAALYRDADRGNDPEVKTARSCTSCHSR